MALFRVCSCCVCVAFEVTLHNPCANGALLCCLFGGLPSCALLQVMGDVFVFVCLVAATSCVTTRALFLFPLHHHHQFFLIFFIVSSSRLHSSSLSSSSSLHTPYTRHAHTPCAYTTHIRHAYAIHAPFLLHPHSHHVFFYQRLASRCP